MRTLIAGCGYVGRELARRLLADGEQVWGLTLAPADLPEGVRPLVADLREPDSLARLPEVDRVVFSAAPTRFDEASYRATYVRGLGNLVAALGAAPSPPQRLVFCSSMGVYDQQDGSWVDEGSPTTTDKANGLVMLECERLVQACPIPAISARIAGIYGGQRCRVVRDVQAGTATTSPGPSVFTNLAHRDDCAGALRHLLTLRDPEDVYVISDDEPVERNHLLLWLASLLQVPAPVEGTGAETSRWLAQRPGDLGKRLSNARLRASGYRLQHPTFRDGYAAIVAALDPPRA